MRADPGWLDEQALRQRLPPACSERSVFPLPKPPTPAVGEGCSRSSAQRAARHYRVAELVSDCIDSLNWLHGCRGPDGAPLSGGPAVARHQGVWARLRAQAGRFQPLPGSSPPRPEAALKELLHGHSPYDEKAVAVSLASYKQGRVSLPASVVDCPSLASTLEGRPSDTLTSINSECCGMFRNRISTSTRSWRGTAQLSANSSGNSTRSA